MRGATISKITIKARPKFQLTHPVRGATSSYVILLSSFSYFNSRTPCGVRRVSPDFFVCLINFNSRTPCGVRRVCVSIHIILTRFQLTHPVRGATHITAESIHSVWISTHAPRAGCDRRAVRELPRRGNFNSRTPCGVRPYPDIVCNDNCVFQLTHPVRGATKLTRICELIDRISTHAPRAGCDMLQVEAPDFHLFQLTHPVRGATILLSKLPLVDFDFNSRTPCGVRRSRRPPHHRALQFQLTHPVRGATIHTESAVAVGRISTHAPRAGCDRHNAHNNSKHRDFNSRTPCGVRLWHNLSTALNLAFQLTHPVRGATLFGISFLRCHTFQLTHPVRGATRLCQLLRMTMEFQLTHPVRGATGY